MKSSHKFYAATGGLLVAALMGFAGAHADTGAPDLEASVSPIEPVASAPANGFEVAGDAEGKETAAPEKTEAAADAEKAPAATEEKTTEVKAEKEAPEAEATEEKTPEATEVTKSEAEPVAKDATEEKTEATEAPQTEESAPAEAKENSEEATPEVTEPTEPATEKVTEDAEAKDEAPATEAAGTEVKSEPFIPVTYTFPSHSSGTASTDTAEEVTTPQPDAQAPLLTMAKNEEAVPSSEKTPNGESQVVFFELPQPAGPALVPGQATPLLNAAVSEEATVNANVVPPAAVQEGAAVTQQKAQVKASSTVNNQAGTMSRSLARTGSIAQYATLLSAGALILGVAFLVGAVATSRRNSRLVDAE